MMRKNVKKILAVILTALTLISAMAITSFASSPTSTDVTVKVDGQVVDFPDQKPTIVNNRTLVPVRFVAESLGYDVEWDDKVNAAVIDNGRIVMYIGTNHAVIDGKHKTLDVKSELIGERTMVPLRVIAETLDCTVDWLARTNTVQITRKNEDGSEKSMWDRLMMSDLFSISEDMDSGYFGCAVLKNASDTTQIPDWYVKQSKNKLQNGDGSYECEIRVEEFDAETLAEIKEMLMIVYPTGYNTVYDLMMKSIKGELWETFRDNEGGVNSGTWGTHYIDGREVNIFVGYSLTHMTININKVGYYNPERPLELDAQTIADLTNSAKEDYLLEKYGLD